MPADKPPAFSFYAKDFMLGTVTMSLAERGAYITLLAYQWDIGSVPTDVVELGRVLGCTRAEAAKSWAAIAEKFQLGADGLWRNQRLEAERTKQIARRAELAANGRQGADQRWNKKDRTVIARPLATPLATALATPLAKQKQADGLSFPDPDPDRTDLSLSLDRTKERERERAQISVSSRGSAIPATSLASEEIGRRAGRFLRLYADLYTKHRNGARLRLIGNSLEFQEACSLVETWDDTRLEKLAVIVLGTDDAFISQTDRSFKIFAMKATWADDRLKAWEVEHGVVA